MLLSKPVVAAIEGYAVAGGIELAAWCDLRVASREAKLGVLCRRWGVPLIDGGTVRLPRLIGLSRALDLILTGRLIDADEAFAMGLVNRVVDVGRARAEAENLAAQIASFPQTCMREDRLSAYESFAFDLERAIDNELRHGMKSLSSPELAEGVSKFVGGSGRGGRAL
jgi:enoyl-CoA hydratase